MLQFDAEEVWKAMEECCKLGLAKSIGVSNFSCAKLSKLLETATIPPAVNQVEMNVAWQQQKLVQFCKEKKIHVSAYSPLGANGAFWGSLAVMESPILKQVAASTNKTIAQVALRWVVEQGVSVIVKSFSKERMEENLRVFDWQSVLKMFPRFTAFLRQEGAKEMDLYFKRGNTNHWRNSGMERCSHRHNYLATQ